MKAAFTLIELLVVIAIISILASLLLPALKAARESGYRVACIGNVKQLGMGMQSYVDNYEGWFPTWYYRTSSPSPAFWYSFVDYEVNGKEESLNNNDLSATGPQVWVCPSNPNHGWGYQDLSYGYNTVLGHYDRDGIPVADWLPNVNIKRVKNPTLLVALADGDGDEYYDTMIGASNQVVGNRHNNGGVIVFVDQHVEWKKQLDTMKTGISWDGANWTGGSWDLRTYRMWGNYSWFEK